MRIIEETYNNLKDDKEVKEWINKIKSYEWFKIIRGEKDKGLYKC